MKTLLATLGVSFALILGAFGQEQSVKTETQIGVRPQHQKQEQVVKGRTNVQPQERTTVRSEEREKPQITTTERNKTEVNIREGEHKHFFHNRWFNHWHGREFHDRTFYVTHYNRVIFINGCWYFYDDGCFWPAFGYDSSCVYPNDEPIQCE